MHGFALAMNASNGILPRPPHDESFLRGAGPLRIRKSLLAWLSLLPLGLAAVAVLPDFLPIHYTIDAQLIRDYIVREANHLELGVGEFYANTAYVYVMFGVGAHPLLGGMFTYVTAWLSVFVALAVAANGGRFWLWWPACGWHLLLVIFTCMHSKEVHAMPALALALVLCGRRFTWRRVAAIGVVVLLYALYFRYYWALVGLLAASFIVLRHRVTDPKRLALAMAAVYVLMFVAYHAVTNDYLTAIRVVLTANRDVDLFSDSVFYNSLDADSVLNDIFNAAFGFVRLVMPFALLAIGKPQYFLFIAWEVANVVAFAWLFARAWRSPETDARTAFAAAWILAFTLVQGIFEADYGTFLRHQTTLLPALALLAVNTIWWPSGVRRTRADARAPSSA